jgi:hydrogenase expression/formation protein HypD
MKYLDEFRDPRLAARLLADIQRTATRSWTLMEVCGGQTHGLLRHGIDDALRGVVELLHGPGCPVCVTPAEVIDQAIELSLRPGVCLATFGDMLRVPGTRESLLAARRRGARVQLVYSPLDGVSLAREQPDSEVVFLAVGFETTAPATALAVQQAVTLGLRNFSVLLAHVRVEPAMAAIAAAPGCQVDGFLAAGHVCTITGYETYESFAKQFHKPVVVTGFEPVDLLQGILGCVLLLEQGRTDVINEYNRSVALAGNAVAQAILQQTLQVADRPWRGLGWMPSGGLVLRPEYAAWDATRKFELLEVDTTNGNQGTRCRSGEVMSGRMRPPACPHFGADCTPESPLGAPMVSGEGACNAYFRYASVQLEGLPCEGGSSIVGETS